MFWLQLVRILKMRASVSNSSESKQNPFLLAGLSVALSLAVLCCILGISAVFIQKYRLIPRFRAWLQNEPYEDIVIAESNVREMQSVETTLNNDSIEVRMAAEEHLPKPEDLQNSVVNQIRNRNEESASQST